MLTRLEFLRRARGMTQADLGRAILYSRSMISVLEHTRPAPDTVSPRLKAALEVFFGESFEALMEPVGD